MTRLRHCFLYYLSWLMFGLGGLLLNIACAPFLPWRRRRPVQRVARRAIRWMFEFWNRWIHATRFIPIHWHNCQDGLAPAGSIIVANHPSLVDATWLLSRLPDTVCIFKRSLLRNPCIAPAALLAGYIAGDLGIDTIRAAAEKLREGCSLLVFPEGTRTARGVDLNPLRPGFALMAARAAAPVQIVRLELSDTLLPRYEPWWQVPRMPVTINITRGPVLAPPRVTAAQAFADEVARHLSPPQTNL